MMQQIMVLVVGDRLDPTWKRYRKTVFCFNNYNKDLFGYFSLLRIILENLKLTTRNRTMRGCSHFLTLFSPI